MHDQESGGMRLGRGFNGGTRVEVIGPLAPCETQPKYASTSLMAESLNS